LEPTLGAAVSWTYLLDGYGGPSDAIMPLIYSQGLTLSWYGHTIPNTHLRKSSIFDEWHNTNVWGQRAISSK